MTTKGDLLPVTAPDFDPAAILVRHIEQLPGWELAIPEEPYDHMGAVLSDAGLQAGINYRHVVYPRVQRLLAAYPQARTTSGFLDLLKAHGAPALLSWNGAKKLRTITQLAEFFAERHVETTEDLRRWLREPDHLADLQGIDGVGPKTVDYLQLLIGMPTVAVDVHLRNFVKQAGLDFKTYADVRELIARTADLMGVGRDVLDHSIWTYMSRMRLAATASGEPSGR